MDAVEIIAEFFGTLITVYAAGTSQGNPYAIAGSFYIAMVFTGFASTPQFNPAVTFAMLLRRIFHGEFDIQTGIKLIVNIVVQLIAATTAALMAWGTSGDTFAYYVQSGYNNSEGFLAEMVYTAVICATCLTVKRVTESLFLSGAAISAGYLTGILSVQNITLGCFNPAAALALNLVHYGKKGNHFSDTWIYIFGPLAGSIIGTAVAVIFIKVDNEDMIDNRTKSLEGRINN